MKNETKEILIESLQPFREHSGRTYEGERLLQFMRSIERNGLLNPIIVRPVDNNQYEIICGHNRAKVMKALGRSTIMAEIRELSDEEATEIFYESNLNQQSFSDWSYSERIKAVKYSEKKIQEYSQQGKRNDLERKRIEESENETSVQIRQKLDQSHKQITTRDKMAHRLGISTATLSKYRRIIKLPGELLDSITRLLDEKKITFEAVYVISNMRDSDIKTLIDGIERYPDRKLDLKILKELPHRGDESKNGDVIYPRSRKAVLEALVSKEAEVEMLDRKR